MFDTMEQWLSEWTTSVTKPAREVQNMLILHLWEEAREGEARGIVELYLKGTLGRSLYKKTGIIGMFERVCALSMVPVDA